MAPVLLLAEHPSPIYGVITFNSNVQITATCPVRTGRGKAYKKIRTLSVGTKVKALYILKNSAYAIENKLAVIVILNIAGIYLTDECETVELFIICNLHTT